jgi:phosphatidylglycerol lysyltransferase
MAGFLGRFARHSGGELWRAARLLGWLRRLVGPAMGLALLVLVAWRAGEVEWDGVANSLARVSPISVLAALGLTALSYLAAGHYDALMHRHLQLPYPASVARRAGMAAIAISQTVGMGLITGTLVRARLLPQIALSRVTQVTLLVGTGFALSWAVLSVTAVLTYRGQGALAIGFLFLAGLVVMRLRQILPCKLPDLATVAGLLACCATDCLMAGLALMALCGAAGVADPALFLLAFVLAFGAGLMSGTPAGIGAFEVVFLTALSGQANPDLLAGIILWRFVYFVGPAVIGAIYGVGADSGPALQDIPVDKAALGPAARAETRVGGQAGHRGLALPSGAVWLVARSGRFLIGMFDPSIRRAPDAIIAALTSRAKAEGRKPAGYKVDARMALAARKARWSVIQVAREAVVDPTDFNLDTPGRAGLRRKLRRAAAAGVVVGIARASRDRDWQAMAEVASIWAGNHGGERGFSIGRVQRSYLQDQIVLTARQGEEILAFASFHLNEAEWVLDILRHRERVEDGTMHALIMGAIDLASRAGCIRLSLAAVPVTGFQDCPKLLSQVTTRLGYSGGAGLAQFKQCFAPRWEPRYLIAPSHIALIEALVTIASEVHGPRDSDLAHHDNEEFGIALDEGACDIARNQNDEVEDVIPCPIEQRPVKAA